MEHIDPFPLFLLESPHGTLHTSHWDRGVGLIVRHGRIGQAEMWSPGPLRNPGSAVVRAVYGHSIQA